MAKDDLVTVEGKVCNLSGGGTYHIELENGLTNSSSVWQDEEVQNQSDLGRPSISGIVSL